jgi:hypothetical protein
LAIAVALTRIAIGYFSILNMLVYFVEGFLPALLLIMWWGIRKIADRQTSDRN